MSDVDEVQPVQPVCDSYCSMAQDTARREEEVPMEVAALAVEGTLDNTAGVPNWSVAEYREWHGRSLDSRLFQGMFSNGRNATMINRRGMRHDTDIGTWDRRWAMLCTWCPGIISPVGPFDLRFVRHKDDILYLREAYTTVTEAGRQF